MPSGSKLCTPGLVPAKFLAAPTTTFADLRRLKLPPITVSDAAMCCSSRAGESECAVRKEAACDGANCLAGVAKERGAGR